MTHPSPNSAARDVRRSMPSRRGPLTRRGPMTRDGFTLTEVLIALAMVSLLLIGISRVFALTSATIGTGQALSSVLRTQRAIGQQITSDFIGLGQNRSNTTGGMVPLVNEKDRSGGAPFLTICNFRVPAYLNEAAQQADVNAPLDTVTNFSQRSNAIRGVDVNGDGAVVGTQSILAGGEMTPLYWYGDRNFRCDTIGFFANGAFRSQTGSSGRFVDDVQSNEAWIWYGHLRVYNSEPGRDLYSNGHGMPGDLRTPTGTPLPNRNNRYAEQFRLGRYSVLLVQPTDHDGAPGTIVPSNLYQYNTVTLNGDPSQPVNFIRRNWWYPTDPNPNAGSRPTLTPLNLDSLTYQFQGGNNVQVSINPTTRVENIGSPGGNIGWALYHCRTDVAGASMREVQGRAQFVQNYDVTVPPARGDEWWRFPPTSWIDRFWINPFPAALNGSNLSRNQHVIAESATQFVVEFAGDFVSQNASGAVLGTNGDQPDGVTDFVIVDGARQVRWYGLPRDTDGDGNIYATGAARFTSPDVITVRDFAGIGDAYPFEKEYPATQANYGLTPVAEPTARPNGNNVNNRPDDSAYVCVWGPAEFADGRGVTLPSGTTINAYAVPQLLRVIIELRDTSGRIQEPVSQEYIFPVPTVRQ